MPNFSNRWGLPLCRKKEDIRRCPGRRRGNAASCRARLEGWILNVAARSPIWGDIDLEAFCHVTGYSREHATRELSNIRRENSTLAFETKLRRKKGNPRKQWGVIVAERKKLRFDERSLFYDVRGNRLHNRTKLGRDGEKIIPTIAFSTRIPRPRGRPRKRGIVQTSMAQSPNELPPCPIYSESQRAENNSIKNTRLCDNSYKREDSYGIQQKDSYGAGRDVAQWRGSTSKKFHPSLRKKAFALLNRLAGCHWDNCKVSFAKPTAYRYALKALTDGHEEKRILSSYSDALFDTHGFAVDQASSTGRIIFFNLSSTVTKARQLLASDGLSREERMAYWYHRHPRNNVFTSEIPAIEIVRLHEQIAASLGISNTGIGVRCAR